MKADASGEHDRMSRQGTATLFKSCVTIFFNYGNKSNMRILLLANIFKERNSKSKF